MKVIAALLAALLSFGLASQILLAARANAQVIEVPPILDPPEDEPEPSPEGNATGSTPDNNTEPAPDDVTEPADVNATSAEHPAGNVSSDEPVPVIPLGSIQSTNPCIEYDEESNIVEIVCDADIYELFSALRTDSITQQLGSGQILINTNITVAEDATFTIDSDGGITYVKFANGNGITVYGAIHVDDMTVTSWDLANGTVIDDSTGSTPRGYLFLVGSDGSRIFNSEFGYMGYDATGYRGVDLMANSTNFHILNSTFHHMWYGFYSNGASNITIASSEYMDNHQYAVDPHTSTYNMTIANNTIYRNPIGLVCSLDCSGIVFEHNVIYNNSGAGVFFSRNTHDSVARYNTIYDNPIGIGFSESSGNEAYGNNITSVGRAIFFTDPENQDDGRTANNRVYNNTISNSLVGIAAFRTSDNVASGNHFENITMAHYRVEANSTLIIDNQTFHEAVIEGQGGENFVTIVNSSSVSIDGEVYDTVLEHSMMLSNQTVIVSSLASRAEPSI